MTLILNATTITLIYLHDTFEVSMYWVRILASVACVLMWFQLFFWMRLFDSTAQYVDLVIETIIDIS